MVYFNDILVINSRFNEIRAGILYVEQTNIVGIFDQFFDIVFSERNFPSINEIDKSFDIAEKLSTIKLRFVHEFEL